MHEMQPAAARIWSAVLIASAIALAAWGGAADNFRPLRSDAPREPLPILETPSGDLPSPPTVFRWKAGAADRDLAQVTVFRASMEVCWSSAPTESTEIVVDPAEVFAQVPAGELLSWRVREVRDGRPLGSSALATFTFTFDIHGRPLGESVGESPILLQR